MQSVKRLTATTTTDYHSDKTKDWAKIPKRANKLTAKIQKSIKQFDWQK